MSIIRMVEADDDLRPRRLEPRNQVEGESKFEELHRRGLALRAGVFARRIGLATHPLPVDIDVGVVFDPAEAHQLRATAHRIVDLEHYRGDQFGPLRDQRTVGFELLFELSVAALLDIEHLLDLMPHRLEILQMYDRDRADFNLALTLHLTEPSAPLAPHRLVLGRRQKIVTRQLTLLR